MRILKLETPLLTGSDVTDWQNFLVSQGVLSGQVDGVFGVATAQGTRDYQEQAGLDPDGVVGPRTLAQAVADGFTSGHQTLLAGMDAASNCSQFAAQIADEGNSWPATTLTPLARPCHHKRLAGSRMPDSN